MHYTFLLLLFKLNEGYTEKGVWGLVLVVVRITGEAASLKRQEMVQKKGFLPHLQLHLHGGEVKQKEGVLSDDNQQSRWWKIGVKKHEIRSTTAHMLLLRSWTELQLSPSLCAGIGDLASTQAQQSKGTAAFAEVGYSQHV